MAAVLAGGPGAALSHRSAAALWGIGEEGVEIELTVLTASPRGRPGIHVYRRPTPADRDLVERLGIPVTGLVRTFVDLASIQGPRRVERAVNEADRLGLVDPPTLRVELQAYRCEPGVRPLRSLLDRRTFRLTRSELERLFLPLARRAAEQARDRLRDQAHTAAGLVNLRFTHEQVRDEPEHVRAVLEATFRRISLAA